MARDILSEFGPENRVEGNRASSGGVERAKDVMDYQPPVGPKHIMDTGVGLRGGIVVGNAGAQGRHGSSDTSGAPGFPNNQNLWNKGTQHG